MPLISHFYGILIYLYKEIGGYHNEYEMSMTLEAAWHAYNNDGEIVKIKGLE